MRSPRGRASLDNTATGKMPMILYARSLSTRRGERWRLKYHRRPACGWNYEADGLSCFRKSSGRRSLRTDRPASIAPARTLGAFRGQLIVNRRR